METCCHAGLCGFKICLGVDYQKSWTPMPLLQKSSANGPILQRNLASWGQLCCLNSWQHFPKQVPAVMSHQNIWRVCFTNWHCRYIEVCFCFTGIWFFVIMFDSDCKRNWRRGGKGGKQERKEREMCPVVTRQAVQQISLQRREILEGWIWSLLTTVLSSVIFNFLHSQLSAAFICSLKTSLSFSFSSV